MLLLLNICEEDDLKMKVRLLDLDLFCAVIP